jgi:hypothetical protein
MALLKSLRENNFLFGTIEGSLTEGVVADQEDCVIAFQESERRRRVA